MTILAAQACAGSSGSATGPDGGEKDAGVAEDASLDRGALPTDSGGETAHADTGGSGDASGDGGVGDAAVDSAQGCTQTPSDGGRVPILVAGGQKQPVGVAVDGTSVYWGNQGDGTIVKCPLSGCGSNPPEVIATGQSNPEQVTVQGGFVYWVDFFGSLNRCPTSGCGAAGPYSYPATSGAGFALDQSTIYWTEFTPGILASCPLTGCTQPTVLYQGAKGLTYGVALGSNEVYFANALTGQVFAAPVTGVPDGGSPRVIVHDPDPSYLALAGSSLYWDSLGSGQVKTLPVSAADAAAPAPFATTDQHAAGITYDGPCGTLYWVSYSAQGSDGGASGGGVYRCPAAGCGDAGPEVVAGPPQIPFFVAVDDGYVYWADKSGGSVWKQAK
jgi:hypothetical protein